MPKSSKNQRYEKKYTEEDLQSALQAIANGMTKKKAAREFGVPRQTLQFRLSNNFTKISHGPSPYLSTEEESLLEKWIVDSQKKGFPRRKEDIQMSVKLFLDKSGRPNPFKDNFPGNVWYNSFLRRHPNLTMRTPEGVTSASSVVSEQDIRKWFNQIETYLKENDYYEILQDPSRIYNGDETNIQLCPNMGKVVAKRGAKNVYEVDKSTAKSNITVMFTFGADGETTPPMMIYPYKRLPQNIIDSVPSGWGIGTSDNGWMKSEVFYEYIGNVLYPHLKKKGVQFPIILFIDGHKSHLTYQMSTLCTKLQIILIALYPNSTRILQPADVGAFRPLKVKWIKALANWRRMNPLEEVKKDKVAKILEPVVNSLEASTIAAGFRATGLFPWDQNAIDYSKCLGKNKSNKEEVEPVVGQPLVGENSEGRLLNLHEFQNIVGEKKLAELQTVNTSSCNDYSEDFMALFKIWRHFQQNTVTEPVDVEESYNIDENDISPDNNEKETAKELNLEVCFPLSKDDTLANGEVDIENLPVQFEDGLVVSTLPEFLQWPKTPERKGKRETEKLPYVITSTGWKQIYENKKNLKEQKLSEKAERKRKREENKKNKIEQKRPKLATTVEKHSKKSAKKKTVQKKKSLPKSPPKSKLVEKNQDAIFEENDNNLDEHSDEHDDTKNYVSHNNMSMIKNVQRDLFYEKPDQKCGVQGNTENTDSTGTSDNKKIRVISSFTILPKNHCETNVAIREKNRKTNENIDATTEPNKEAKDDLFVKLV